MMDSHLGTTLDIPRRLWQNLRLFRCRCGDIRLECATGVYERTPVEAEMAEHSGHSESDRDGR